MSAFDADAMEANLSELFSDSYASVETEGDRVIVNCAELGTRKCRREVEDAFDGSGGFLSGLVDKAIGADVEAYEDFDIAEKDGKLVITGK